MITDKEIEYIYDNWYDHKYLQPYIWGKSFTQANPETYLAMYRGAIFEETSTGLSFQKIQIRTISKKNKIKEKTIEFLWAMSKFSLTILHDWLDFLSISTFKDYETTVISNPDAIRNILEKKFTHLHTQRIYIL